MSQLVRSILSGWAGNPIRSQPFHKDKDVALIPGAPGFARDFILSLPGRGAALVPGRCDLTDTVADRTPGMTQGKDPVRVLESSRYYVVLNFASSFKCPVRLELF